MRHVLARIDGDHCASEIANAVDVIQAIRWAATSWDELTESTIRNYFAKCGITQQLVADDEDLEQEFADLAKELANEIDSDMNPKEYADFDSETSTSEPAINSDQVDWREESRNANRR